MFRSILLLCSIIATFTLFSESIKRFDKGFFEMDEKVLHLKGSPYEMGFQHGQLLKEQIKENINRYLNKDRPEMSDRIHSFSENLPKLLAHVPARFHEEMQGLADGSGIPLKKIIQLNLFPELFHCTGLTVGSEAAKEGKLYHVRVLDYGVGKGLQDSRILMAVEPEDGNPFVNVSYAGFIGCVTGMNSEKIALGEIGGGGYGNWDGIPMSFLMRHVLEKASTLEEAKHLFANSPRTCEFYYVISDGKDQSSCGVYATASQIRFIEPGSSYSLMAPKSCEGEYDLSGNKYFQSYFDIAGSSHQIAVLAGEKEVIALFHKQPSNCVVLTGFTGPERYPVIVERLLEAYGQVDEKVLQEVIKAPVTKETNLHNAIFLPSELKFWVSHAGPAEEPASEQPYQEYSFNELFQVTSFSRL